MYRMYKAPEAKRMTSSVVVSCTRRDGPTLGVNAQLNSLDHSKPDQALPFSGNETLIHPPKNRKSSWKVPADQPPIVKGECCVVSSHVEAFYSGRLHADLQTAS